MKYTITKNRPPRFVREKPISPLHDEETEDIEPETAAPPPTPVLHRVQLDEVMRLREELFPTLSYDKALPDSSATEFHATSNSTVTATSAGSTLSTPDHDTEDTNTTPSENLSQEEKLLEKKDTASTVLHQDKKRQPGLVDMVTETAAITPIPIQKKSYTEYLKSLDELQEFLETATHEERNILMVKIKSIFDSLLLQIMTKRDTLAEPDTTNENTEEAALLKNEQDQEADDSMVGSITETTSNEEENLSTSSPEEIDPVSVNQEEMYFKQPAFVEEKQDDNYPFPPSSSVSPYKDILKEQLIPAFEAIIIQPAGNRDLTRLVEIVKAIQKHARLATVENDEVYGETMQLITTQMSHILLDLPPQEYQSLMLNHELQQLTRDMDDTRMHPEKSRYLRRFHRLQNASK